MSGSMLSAGPRFFRGVEVAAADRDRRMAERKSNADLDRAAEAEMRAAAATSTPKKKRGPADNMDHDIDLGRDRLNY